MDRIVNGIAMTRASWGVLRQDRRLMLFPGVSFLLVALVSMGFLIPFWGSGRLEALTYGEVDLVTIVVGFLYYLTVYSIVIFCNVAVVASALMRLDGKPGTLGNGFQAAADRLPAIIGYAAIAATVGVLLDYMSRRTGLVGRLLFSGLGVAWSLATFLVAPVLAMEGLGPISAIGRSASLLRQTWGEQVVGRAGISLVFGIISVIVVIPIVGLFSVLVDTNLAAALMISAVGVIAVAALSLLATTLQAIFTASVYRYATTGDGGSMLPAGSIERTFGGRRGLSPP